MEHSNSIFNIAFRQFFHERVETFVPIFLHQFGHIVGNDETQVIENTGSYDRFGFRFKVGQHLWGCYQNKEGFQEGTSVHVAKIAFPTRLGSLGKILYLGSMKDLDEHSRACEEACGLISGMFLYQLHELSTVAGSSWDVNDPSTMEIVVNKGNAGAIYANCKEIRNGYSIGLKRGQMAKIKAARAEAHRFLYEEANDRATPIQRKIQLVRLTSKE